MNRSTIIAAVVLIGVASRALGASVDPGPPRSYGGDLTTRPALTGDWGGLRDDWSARGLTFDLTVTQIYQGVVDGGRREKGEYGGRGDLVLLFDTQQAGLWPGGFLKAEVEGNWADAINPATGALLPANTNALFPEPGEKLGVPELSFTQFLSHYVGITAGKFQTVSSGDLNEFAHGKGETQFFNLAFNINPVSLMVPYSTLGAGIVALPTADPTHALVKLVVLSATGTATTSGFDDLDDGAIIASEGRVRTIFFDRTGHHLLGGFNSTKTYTQLDQRLRFVVRNGELVPEDDTWAIFYNFDQFLYERDKAAGQGMGVFGRFGVSEGSPNPVEYFYSAGVGGKGMIAGRPLDRFGLGFYYSANNEPTLQVPFFPDLTFLRDEWGFEAYYNFALTPWMSLTPDIQVIRPAQKRQIASGESIDTATVPGARLHLVF